MVLVLAGALLAGGWGRRQPPEPPKEPEKKPFTPTLGAKGIHWTVPDAQGRPLWEVDAAEGTGNTAEGHAQLKGVRCKIHEGGKLAMQASAPRVDADLTGKQLVLLGGVSARTADGRRSFRSDKVTLNVKEDRVTRVEARGAVKLNVDGTEVEGERLSTNPQIREGEME